MENVQFTLERTKERDLVGTIKYANQGHILYFSEIDMLSDLSYAIRHFGIKEIVEYNVSSNNTNQRHGLRYGMTKLIMNEYGLVYTKEEYMKDFCKELNRKEGKNNNERDEFELER